MSCIGCRAIVDHEGTAMLRKRLAPSLLLVALVSGCGTAAQSPSATTQASSSQPAATTAASPSSAPSAATTTLTFGMNSSSSLLPTAKLLTDNFAKTHPEVKVDTQLIANNDIAPTFYKEAAAGTLPDVVFTADSYVLPFNENGVTIDMEPLAKADTTFDLGDIYPNMLGLSQVDGKGLYMMPSSFDVVTMYYNKTCSPRPGRRCRRLTGPGTTSPPPARRSRRRPATTASRTAAICPAVRLVGLLRAVPVRLRRQGHLRRRQDRVAELPGVLAGEQAYVDMWTKDNIAQPLDFDSWRRLLLGRQVRDDVPDPGPHERAARPGDRDRFEWDVQVIPSHPKGKFTGMGTYGFAISENAKDPKLAWDFVKFMDSKDAQLALLQTYSGMPLLKSLARRSDHLVDGGAAGRTSPRSSRTARTASSRRTSRPAAAACMRARSAQDIKDALEKSIRGTSSVTDAFTTANDKIQACLDKAITGQDVR